MAVSHSEALCWTTLPLLWQNWEAFRFVRCLDRGDNTLIHGRLVEWVPDKRICFICLFACLWIWSQKRHMWWCAHRSQRSTLWESVLSYPVLPMTEFTSYNLAARTFICWAISPAFGLLLCVHSLSPFLFIVSHRKIKHEEPGTLILKVYSVE